MNYSNPSHLIAPQRRRSGPGFNETRWKVPASYRLSCWTLIHPINYNISLPTANLIKNWTNQTSTHNTSQTSHQHLRSLWTDNQRCRDGVWKNIICQVRQRTHQVDNKDYLLCPGWTLPLMNQRMSRELKTRRKKREWGIFIFETRKRIMFITFLEYSIDCVCVSNVAIGLGLDDELQLVRETVVIVDRQYHRHPVESLRHKGKVYIYYVCPEPTAAVIIITLLITLIH